jgi:hypothetical protein
MNTKYAAPTKSAAAPARGNAPLQTIRLGRIKAVVWENTANQRPFHNVTFARTYMDQDKKFHDTDSFGRDDLLLLSKLADQAHSFVCDRLASMKSEGESE